MALTKPGKSASLPTGQSVSARAAQVVPPSALPGRNQVPGYSQALAPLSEATTHLVYITQKQWRKVKDTLNQNADDKLIVEGYPVLDKRIVQGGTLTVYVQSTTTKLLEEAKHEQQKAAIPK